MKQNKFLFKLENKKIRLEIPNRKNSKKLIDFFENYLKKKKMDLKKVRVITGLIFLNMSPLHHHPFDKLLFIYGKFFLQKNLKINYNDH